MVFLLKIILFSNIMKNNSFTNQNKKQDCFDLIIVGGGPAGITAGIYAARQGIKTLLITKEFGGQVLKKAGMIENYPGFKEISALDLIKKFENHLKKFESQGKIKIVFENVGKIKKDNNYFSILTENKKEYKSRAVIVATGADPRPLEVPGEKEFIGKGVSYCVTCDGACFQNKNVAVIGGGESGFEAAIFLANFAKKIYVLEYSPYIKATMDNQKKAKNTGKIEIITLAEVKEIRGENFVNSIIYQDLKTKENKTLNVNGVFIEIGNQPATSLVKGLAKFDHLINNLDEIAIDPRTCATSTPGLFAAGDVTDVAFKQIIVACGEGSKAAMSAFKYLQ